MQDYIKAFFSYLDDRIRYLADLYQAGRQDEAATLCCVYIDGLANSLWPSAPSKRNFVRALVEHSGQVQMSLYHPRAMVRWLQSSDRSKLKALAPKIETAISPLDSPMAEAPFRAALAACLSKPEMQLIDKELWRATIAAVAYERIRIPWVHRLQGYGAVSFGVSSLSDIDFGTMHAALTAIASAARRISEESGKLFGHNFAGVGHHP